MDNKKYKEKVEIQEKIRRVDGAMAQEGMPLTKDIKKKLYNCIIGKTTTTKERKKLLIKLKSICLTLRDLGRSFLVFLAELEDIETRINDERIDMILSKKEKKPKN